MVDPTNMTSGVGQDPSTFLALLQDQFNHAQLLESKEKWELAYRQYQSIVHKSVYYLK